MKPLMEPSGPPRRTDRAERFIRSGARGTSSGRRKSDFQRRIFPLWASRVKRRRRTDSFNPVHVTGSEWWNNDWTCFVSPPTHPHPRDGFRMFRSRVQSGRVSESLGCGLCEREREREQQQQQQLLGISRTKRAETPRFSFSVLLFFSILFRVRQRNIYHC